MINGKNRVVALFLGAPGCGKGTQSARLASELGIPRFSAGDIFRSEAAKDTELAHTIRNRLAEGGLINDDLACQTVASHLRYSTPDDGFILDGFPRTLEQAIFTTRLLSDLGAGATQLVFHLDVPEDVAVARLSRRRQCMTCGVASSAQFDSGAVELRCSVDGGMLVKREDDTDEVIRRRLSDYATLSAPLIRYYASDGYIRIDGRKHPEAVFDQIREAVVTRTGPAILYQRPA